MYTIVMSDDLPIAGKTYISSKKAATTTGYAQDYIGQLARGGLIAAQRVGGLWYVDPDSLAGYQKSAADSKPLPPVGQQTPALESVVSFDGKDYISASRAAKITGYNQDYVGQLARSGKILSRQIGNRWYVERSGLVAHKNEKDRLLAAVQVESVGLATKSHSEPYSALQSVPAFSSQRSVGEYAGAGPVLTYFNEHRRDLMPFAPADSRLVASGVNTSSGVSIPRRVTKLKARKMTLEPMTESEPTAKMPRISALRVATGAITALTVVVMVAYGLFSLKDTSVYASATAEKASMLSNPYVASALQSVEALSVGIEGLLVEELVYTRTRAL